MQVNIKDTEGGFILAVCDSELLGNCFSEGDAQLDLTSDFYKGEEKSEDDIADLMRNAYLVNLVGEKACNLAKREGLLEDEEIKRIKDVPYAQVLLRE